MTEKLIQRFQALKLEHELPNQNCGEYNQGFVKAMNIAINTVKKESENTYPVIQYINNEEGD
ncbi:MAG: hypothetical protein PHQ74_15050 [Crocinitomicaceae bacterium]|nr:hypothetical protein [Crocinitomicaceae bacterium]